jgi:hypothetical protein
VAAGLRYGLDNFLTDFIGKAFKFFEREALKIVRIVDLA